MIYAIITFKNSNKDDVVMKEKTNGGVIVLPGIGN